MTELKTLLCAAVRMENNYIEEWVRYYKNLGISKIVLFDNNTFNGERITDVPYVKQMVDEDFITVIPQYDIRGIQTAQFTECYNLFYKDYDWLTFLDIDEYLVLEKHDNISDFLSQEKFKNFDLIHVQWKIFDDNGLVHVENGDYSLQSRFTHPLDVGKLIDLYETKKETGSYAYFYHKTILRGRVYKKIKFTGGNTHTIDKHSDNTLKACDVNGTPVELFDMAHKPVLYAEAWLNHYICKTIEEYITNKMVRKTGATRSNNDRNERVDLRLFLKYNLLTFEKLQYMHDKCPEECESLLNFITVCCGKYSFNFDETPLIPRL